MVELNVLDLLYCAHAATPHVLRAAGDGPRHVADMVHISSVVGRVARSGNGVYRLTKHGVGAFIESLRQELTKRYVRVSLVEPVRQRPSSLLIRNAGVILHRMCADFGQASVQQVVRFEHGGAPLKNYPLSAQLARGTKVIRCRRCLLPSGHLAGDWAEVAAINLKAWA
jgi:short chain dehydrogenase